MNDTAHDDFFKLTALILMYLYSLDKTSKLFIKQIDGKVNLQSHSKCCHTSNPLVLRLCNVKEIILLE